MADRMDGQVALVTGGGRGIGARIACELADAGMNVAVSARSADQVEEVAREIGGLGVVADVSRQDDVERMVAEVERELGPIDLLVANAGSRTGATRPGRTTRTSGGTCSRSMSSARSSLGARSCRG
jgi:NAD(P)-dependent dehydrogenase (short-subunit alcohol dehydrogenase family)